MTKTHSQIFSRHKCITFFSSADRQRLQDQVYAKLCFYVFQSNYNFLGVEKLILPISAIAFANQTFEKSY